MTTLKLILIEIHDLVIVDASTFESSNDLLAYLTPRWNHRICIINVEKHWRNICKRPFICFLFVDASILKRVERYEAKFDTMDGFYSRDLQPGNQEYYDILQIAHYKIVNDYNSISELKEYLVKLDIVRDLFIRPTWDTYFIRLARLASKRSNCMKRQVGCVIVHNHRIISTGYNGTPTGLKNCRDGGCLRCNGGATSGTNLDTCLCIHAEDNAILEAGKPRLTYPSQLYCTLFPCVSCAKKIVQMGIAELIYDQDYNQDLRSVCMAMFNEANIQVRKHIDY